MKNLNYGVIGNCKSAALISATGSIDWCCLPDFDSPSVFAKLLDNNNGGEFVIKVSPDYTVRQEYAPKTNILVTRYTNGFDRFELIDFMPRYKTDTGHYHCPPDIIRYIRHISGKPVIRIHYNPRPYYSRHDVRREVRKEYIKDVTDNGSYDSMYLYSDLDYSDIAKEKPIYIEQDVYLLLSYNQKIIPPDMDTILLEYEKTRVYWLDWSSKTRRFSRFNSEINRSALMLKLLSFQKTGAILAALTTSLPEELGGERNWDYRYCWIRDAGMNIAVLTKISHYNVAKRFLNFILDIIPYKDEKIQIMYGIKGQKSLQEKTLDWLEGYEGSTPVRIGNAAFTQKQNDIFGILLDIIYQYLIIYRREVVEIREDLWTIVRTLARNVEKQWIKKDRGIWEFRSAAKHFTFSKVLCWVAMDRAVKIADYFSMNNYARVWTDMREKIKKDILKKGWNTQINSFSQAYGEPYLDAANLLMEHYGFINALDPRYISTVKLTKERLSRNGMMYRYRNRDDFGVPNSSFIVCTFWLIKSLYKIGETEDAEQLFEQMMNLRNHLGLLSEDIDFETHRLLGNFPQGYSHIALIDTAITLCDEDVTDELHWKDIPCFMA